MYKVATLFIAFCLLASALLLNAQEITQQQIPLSAPKVVSFKERADYEVIHPVRKLHRFIEQGEDREREFKFIPKAVGADAIHFDVPVPTHQQRAAVSSPAPSVSFNGTLDNGTLIPPDIRGAAGPNHVMETTNQEFKIYTKTGSLVSTVSITTFFSSTGGSGYFDPHIVYDPNNGRFIICIDGNVSNGHGGIFLAVSQTSDPTGSWYVYSFDGIGNTTDFLDYPLLGFNTNWVIVTGNDFLGSGGNTGKIYVLNRAGLYSGSIGTVTTFTDANVFSLAPAQTYDASQTTEYMVEDWNGNSGSNGYVRIGKITGTATAPIYTSGTTLGVNQPWSETSIGAKQSGSSQTIEDGDTRVGNALYINGSLWFCQTAFLPASSPTHASVQWWQVNAATPTVQQFGRVDDATGSMFYFYPSINVNSNGDALLGYCQSSSTTYASAAYSVRASADAVNTLQNGYMYKAGVANYYKTYGGGRNRWGDFTGTAVDPSNNSFWNFSEWANTSNKWGTVIANVVVTAAAPCNVATGMNTTNIADNSATFNWTAVSGATSYNIQYRVLGTSSWSTGTSSTPSYSAAGLAAGTNYEWQVQTVCSGGVSSYTASTTFKTTGISCGIPSGLTSSGITNTNATLSWTAITGVTSYNLQWKQSSSSTWTPVASLATNSYALSGLTACTSYQFQVQANCSGTLSAYSGSASFTTIGCAVSYCTSKGTSTAYEYISKVAIGTISNTSGDNAGYGNYTNLSTNLAGGASTTITLTPGFKGAAYTEYWTVYIDYNHNGSFGDAGEKVTTGSGNAAISKSFTIPITALNGSTRMRVQMQYANYVTNSCTTYTYGEVEDYTVNITGNAQNPAYNEENFPVEPEIIENINQFNLFPNPAHDNITVEFMSRTDGNIKLNIYSLSGQKVLSSEVVTQEGINSKNINTGFLSDGVYIFEIVVNGETKRQKFTISK